MRLLISVLMIGQLTACMRHEVANDDSGKNQYRPLPCVEVSILTTGNRIASAYVRHSRDAVLFRLSSETPDYACGIPACGVKSVVTLSFQDNINFNPIRYENFDQSFDMFGDGTIILVPLGGNDSNAIGAFVNLVSGKRYFFAHSITSGRLPAKARSLAKLRHEIKIITPEETRSAGELARFPEFER
jgi:hypothetical protein